jgi:serine protease
MSLGGTGSCPAAWQQAVDDVVNAGTLVVVAAGNSSTDVSGFVPASCSGVMAVAATNRSGSLAGYSNSGAGVAISAPGGDSSGAILSTLNSGTQGPVASPGGDTYGYYMGTSMATPHVSGVASLVWSANPGLTVVQVRQVLQSTARAFPAGSNCTPSICGAGIVDAYAAVSSVVSPPAITGLQPPFEVAGSPAFKLTVLGANFVAGSIVYWNGSPRPTTYVNPGQLTADIGAADVASKGTANITVSDGASLPMFGSHAFSISGPMSRRAYLPLAIRP